MFLEKGGLGDEVAFVAETCTPPPQLQEPSSLLTCPFLEGHWPEGRRWEQEEWLEQGPTAHLCAWRI